jgi:glucokinase
VPANKLIIGVDIGATKTKLAFLHQGKLDVFGHFATPRDPKQEVAHIAECIAGAKLPSGIAGIGIGCPGPLDQEKGIILTPPNLQNWHGFELVRSLDDALHAPVKLENDANAGALGEALYGAGRGYDSVFYMTISTGIGSGIVIDKKIYRGSKGMAGEIWAFAPGIFGGQTGGKNITERASGNGICACVKERIDRGEKTSIPSDNISTHTILDANEKGDRLALDVMKTAVDTLSGSLIFIQALLAPDIIVLGGGLCTDSKWFVDPICARVKEILPDALQQAPIVRAQAWDNAVLLGAVNIFNS